MAHIIIGLTGKKKSGKTSVAHHLCEKHGFVEVMVAEPLKEIIGRYLFYFTEKQLYGDLKDVTDDRWGVSPRFVFKDFGKYLKLRYGDDWLSKRAMFRIGELMTRYPKGVRVVLSDCRFPRELEVVETVGGFTCRVTRTDAVYEDEDDTEVAADGIATAFELSAKTGNLDDLYAQADKMMEKIDIAIR